MTASRLLRKSAEAWGLGKEKEGWREMDGCTHDGGKVAHSVNAPTPGPGVRAATFSGPGTHKSLFLFRAAGADLGIAIREKVGRARPKLRSLT